MTESWKYARPITLDPVTKEDNYQVKIELTASNFDYSKAKLDGSDLRFYLADKTELNYWIEKWDTLGTSIIWVKVVRAGTDTLFMHYGNPSANTESSGDNTFDFFDDCSGSVDRWSTVGNITHSYFNGQLKVGAGIGGEETEGEHIYYAGKSFSRSEGYAFGFTVIQHTNWLGARLCSNGSKVSGYGLTWFPLGNLYTYKEATDVWPSCDGTSGTSWSAPAKIEIRHFGINTIKEYIDNVLRLELEYSQHDSGYVGLGAGCQCTSEFTVDDIYVRKYTTPEPSATVGDEELLVRLVEFKSEPQGAVIKVVY